MLGIRNKMESTRLSTTDNSLSVKGNTTILPLYTFSYFVTSDKLVRGIKTFSTKVNANKLNANEEFLF
jgi:hypothetical protein